MIYRVSFAQETGYRDRLEIAAIEAAVEHVRARIGVSTGLVESDQPLCGLPGQVRNGHPGGAPNRRRPNAGPAGSPQGNARSGGKSADGHGPSGSITSVDVHSCVRSGSWETMARFRARSVG